MRSIFRTSLISIYCQNHPRQLLLSLLLTINTYKTGPKYRTHKPAVLKNLAVAYLNMQLPNFLKLPVYGFDISDQSYKYLLLKEEKEGVVVDDFGGANIPNGVIERGEID